MSKFEFQDKVFEQFLLDNFDYDKDGRVSAEDASKVESMQITGDIAPQITNLQGIEHFANLRELTVQHTNICTLDVSRNRNLEHLNCSDSRLLRLNLGRLTKLKRLYCSDNRLERLDVSGLPSLKLLHCTNNRLTELNLACKRQLIVLLCGNNLLTDLDVSGSPLMFLRCENNLLAELDLSKNKHLIDVQFNGNPLARVSLPAFIENRIEEIICDTRQLETIKQPYNHLWDKAELSFDHDAEIKVDFIPAINARDTKQQTKLKTNMRTLFLSLLITCAFASCSKQENTDKPFLTITQTGYTCESTTSQIRVNVESNVEWKIVYQEDPNPWIEFGKTDWGVMVWVEANTSYQRHKTFKIISKDGTIEYDLYITQKQADDFVPGSGENTQLSVTPNNLHFSWEGGTKTVEVNSTALWRVLDDGNRTVLQPTISPLSGIEKGTLTITVPKTDPIQTTRANTIDCIIKIVSGSQMVELTVTQGATEIPM